MKIRFNHLLKTFLTYSKSERNGILVLFSILLLLIFWNLMLPEPKSDDVKNDFEAFKKSIDSLSAGDSVSYGSFKHTLPVREKIRESHPIKIIAKVEINSADSSQLVELPGIGPILACRILKYRNLLGGYMHKEQLSEVYGLKPENLSHAGPFINIDTTGIIKIDLDSATFSVLARHPYIGKEKAKLIFKDRNKHKYQRRLNYFSSYGDAFDSVQWCKLKPYLKHD